MVDPKPGGKTARPSRVVSYQNFADALPESPEALGSPGSVIVDVSEEASRAIWEHLYEGAAGVKGGAVISPDHLFEF